MHIKEIECSIVRIKSNTGQVCGAGYLISETKVITCAHVVNLSLNHNIARQVKPEEKIQFDFPFLKSQLLFGQVEEWVPYEKSGEGDLACIAFLKGLPEGARPVCMVNPEDLFRHPFAIYGFPKFYDMGVWATGSLLASLATGLVQIEDIKETGFHVSGGFSGAPVHDTFLESTVGLVFATDLNEGIKTAFMIPTKEILRRLPNIFHTSIPKKRINNKLPQRTSFIGRENDLKKLLSMLEETGLPICVSGMSGMGKSDLVIECARAALFEKKIYNYVVWVSDRDSTLSLSEIINEVAILFGPKQVEALSLTEKRTIIRDILSNKKVLIIVDNYETVIDDQITAFARDCPYPSRFIFTSREKPDNFRSLPLHEMDEEDALIFLRHWGKEKGAEFIAIANESSLIQLAINTGRNPLAMTWAVGQIAQGGATVESVSRLLSSATGNLFDNLFKEAWDAMPSPAKKLFMAAAVFPAPITKDALQFVSDLSTTDVDDSVYRLVRYSFLEPSNSLCESDRRYGMHSLTHSYAKRMLENEVSLDLEFRERVIGFWLQFSKEHGGMQWNWEGYEKIAQHSENIFSTIDWCVEHERWDEIKAFRAHLSNSLSIRGLWKRRVDLAHFAIDASQKSKDPRSEAWCWCYDLAYIFLKTGDLEKASEATEKALTLFTNLKEALLEDQLGKAACLHHLGKIEEKRENYQQAKKYYQESRVLYEADPEYDPFLASELAIINFRLGLNEDAELEFSSIVKKTSEMSGKCRIVLSRCLGYLGEIKVQEGTLHKAEDFYRQALDVAMDIGRVDEIAANSLRLANLLRNRKKYPEASNYAQEALDTYRQMGDQEGVKNSKQEMQDISDEVI